MIQTYKFLSRKEDIDPSVFFQMAPQRPGANSKKIFKKQTRLDVRKHFFSQRTGCGWNALKNDVVEVKKTGTFKKKYDRVIERRRERMENDQYIRR